MQDIKTVIARNITALRKSKSWTQAELAHRINYTDKAVSKWERAESTPDVTVLKSMAEIFQVPIQYLFENEHQNDAKHVHAASAQLQNRNRIIIALVSAAAVFLIASVLFVSSSFLNFSICHPSWMLYIFAIPPALTVLLVFNSIWGKRRVNLLIISLLIWSVLLAIYLSFDAPDMWMVFIIGIPAQIIVFLIAPIRRIKYHKPVKSTVNE